MYFGFLPRLAFSGEFSQFIINIAGKISEAAMCGAGFAQRSFLLVNTDKKRKENFPHI
jgi:hypothetical protein